MPSLGADMDAGTVTHWLVQPGDEVHRGQIVAIVETDKADVEVEVFEDGVVDELLVPEGVRVDVGTALARLTPPGTKPRPRREQRPRTATRARKATRKTPRKTAAKRREPAAPAAAPEPTATHWVAPSPAPPRPAARPSAPPPAPRPSDGGSGAPVSPVVRRRATALGVDLRTITGTGRGGAITRGDVERAAAATGAQTSTSTEGRARISPRARALATERGVELTGVVGSGPGGAITGSDIEAAPSPRPTSEPSAPTDRGAAMRAAIARAMSRSKREIPHYYLAQDIDFSAAQGFLQDRNAAASVTERILPAALLLKATALAVRHIPELNGFWLQDELHPSDAVHLGVAISLRGGGLVAPAIHDADRQPLDELMAALRDLVNRARAGSLRASELSDPTITVTNLGDQGVQLVHGAIYPPQVALVGFGAILERPWAEDGMVGARPVVTTTLAADHRASDGARGALLLKRIDSLLQEPTGL